MIVRSVMEGFGETHSYSEVLGELRFAWQTVIDREIPRFQLALEHPDDTPRQALTRFVDQ